jgi:hypothetical protein
MWKPKIKIMPKFLTWISNGWMRGITLAPFGIYVIEKNLTNLFIINHESIHWRQQLEMLIIFFYLWYLIEWLIRIPINGKAAYRSISLEREGWENRENLDYLETRKSYAWLKYMRK